MKFTLMRENAEKLQAYQTISTETLLGIFQDVCKDVKSDTGKSVEDCGTQDVTALTSRLIWMGNLFTWLLEANEAVLTGTSRYTKLTGMRDELKAQIVNLSQKLKETDDRELEIQKLTRTCQTLQSQLSELRSKIQTYNTLEKRVSSLSQEKELLEKQLSSLRETDFSVLEKEVLSLRQRTEVLAHRQVQLTQEKDSLEEEVLIKQRENENLESEIVALKKEREDQLQRNAELEETVSGFAHLQIDFSAIETQLQIAKKNYEDLSANYDKAKETYDSLTLEHSALLTQKNVLDTTLGQLQLEMKTMDAQIPILRDKISDLEVQRQESAEKNAALMEAHNEITLQVRHLEDEYIRLSTSVQPGLEAQLTLAKENRANAEELRASTQRQLEQLEQEISELQNVIQEISLEVAKAERMIDEKRQERDLLFGNKQSLESDIARLIQEKKELEQSLQSKGESDLRSKLLVQNENLKTRLNECHSMEKQLSELDSQVSQKVQDMEALQIKLLEMENRRTEISQAVAQTEASLDVLRKNESELQRQEAMLANMKQIITTLESDSARLRKRTEKNAFSIDAVLREEMDQAEKTIKNVRGAITSYTALLQNAMEE